MSSLEMIQALRISQCRSLQRCSVFPILPVDVQDVRNMQARPIQEPHKGTGTERSEADDQTEEPKPAFRTRSRTRSQGKKTAVTPAASSKPPPVKRVRVIMFDDVCILPAVASRCCFLNQSFLSCCVAFTWWGLAKSN